MISPQHAGQGIQKHIKIHRLAQNAEDLHSQRFLQKVVGQMIRQQDGRRRLMQFTQKTNHLQATKPETVGIALADSPAGQAAWIYEKYQSKTDNNGLAEDALSTDDMLDAISLFWFTNSATSSGR